MIINCYYTGAPPAQTTFDALPLYAPFSRLGDTELQVKVGDNSAFDVCRMLLLLEISPQTPVTVAYVHQIRWSHQPPEQDDYA